MHFLWALLEKQESITQALNNNFGIGFIIRYPPTLVYQNGSIGSVENVDAGNYPPPPQSDSISPPSPSFSEDNLPPPPAEFR